MRTLLLARDLKINIRKRAVGRFFEWDKLDRAVGGKDKALASAWIDHNFTKLVMVLGTKLCITPRMLRMNNEPLIFQVSRTDTSRLPDRPPLPLQHLPFLQGAELG